MPLTAPCLASASSTRVLTAGQPASTHAAAKGAFPISNDFGPRRAPRRPSEPLRPPVRYSSPVPPATPLLLGRMRGTGAPASPTPLERPRGGSVGRCAYLASVPAPRLSADARTDWVLPTIPYTSLTLPAHSLMVCHASCTCWQAQCRWRRPRAPPLAADARPRRSWPHGSFFDRRSAGRIQGAVMVAPGR